MNAGRWLSDRQPAPPVELSDAIARALSGGGGAGRTFGDGDSARTQLIGAVENLLPRVVTAGGVERSAALDLLTLDALITYAMEASSDSAAHCEATAESILSMIAAAARER